MTLFPDPALLPDEYAAWVAECAAAGFTPEERIADRDMGPGAVDIIGHWTVEEMIAAGMMPARDEPFHALEPDWRER